MKTLRKEFSKKKFCWSIEHPDQFYLTQWQITNDIDPYFLTYKVIFALIYLSGIIFMVYHGSRFPPGISIQPLCYYTFWVFFVNVAYMLSSCYVVCYKYSKREFEENHRIYVAVWILQSIAIDSSFAVAIGYFTFVYLLEDHSFSLGTAVLHLWNPVVIAMDVMIGSIPVRLLHIYPSLILAFTYGMFSYVYYLSGGRNIYGERRLYKALDFDEQPVFAASVLFGMLCYIAFGRILVYLKYLLRVTIYRKFFLSTGNKDTVTRYIGEESVITATN